MLSFWKIGQVDVALPCNCRNLQTTTTCSGVIAAWKMSKQLKETEEVEDFVLKKFAL